MGLGDHTRPRRSKAVRCDSTKRCGFSIRSEMAGEAPTTAALAAAGNPEGCWRLAGGETPGSRSPTDAPRRGAGAVGVACDSGTPPGCIPLSIRIPGVVAALDPRLISGTAPPCKDVRKRVDFE